VGRGGQNSLKSEKGGVAGGGGGGEGETNGTPASVGALMFFDCALTHVFELLHASLLYDDKSIR
jgi:hypothetical protein